VEKEHANLLTRIGARDYCFSKAVLAATLPQ
jgi:hypothetical protein